MKTRQQLLSEKADEERRRGREWLLPYMTNNRPRYLTKAELRDAAILELHISKSSFDFAWMDAIERSDRHDWYEPLRKRLRTKN